MGTEVDGYLRELHSAAPSLKVETYDRRLVPAIALCIAGVVAGAAAGRLLAPRPSFPDPFFQSRTFSPQVIFNARFMPDGQSVVFSAAVEGNSPRLFVSRPEGTEPQPFGLDRRQHGHLH